VTNAELREWLKDRPVDMALYSRVALNYTATPIFEDGLDDPIAKRVHVVEGVATVPVPADLEPPAAMTPGEPEAAAEDVRAALAAIPNDRLDWDRWNTMGLLVYAATGGDPEGVELWSEWSAKHEAHDDAEVEARWAHFEKHPPTKGGAGSLFRWAKEADPSFVSPKGRERTDAAVEGLKALIERGVEPPVVREMPELRGQHDPDVAAYVLGGALDTPAAPALYAEGAFWEWAGAHWRALDDDEVMRRIFAAHRTPYTGFDKNGEPVERHLAMSHQKARSVFETMKDERSGAKDAFARATSGVPFRNGFLPIDPKTGALGGLRPHDPQHANRHCLDADWTGPLVGQPPADSLLALYLSRYTADMVRSMRAVVAVVAAGIMTQLDQPQAVFLYSKAGNTGKSTFINLLTGIVPDHVQSHISLHDLMNNDFAACGLVGSLLNCRSEMPSSRDLRGDRFKEVVEADPIEVNRKFRDPVKFRPRAALVYAGNTLPNIVGGIDHGVRRRFYGLPFDQSIPDGLGDGERYKGDLGRDIAAKETGLVLAWALPVLAGIVKEGRLPQTAESGAAMKEWLHDADAVEGFVAERIEGDPAGFVPWNELWSHFKVWWAQEGYTAALPTRKQFDSRAKEPLEALGAEVGRRQVAGQRTRGVAGVRFRPAEEE